jgi:hypothetical protein
MRTAAPPNRTLSIPEMLKPVAKASLARIGKPE